jgi:DNA-binding CsgD family transcriptional regulator
MVSTLHRSQGMWPDLPFVGRDREIAVLNDALTQAIDGVGSLVLISGEAGIGKTALVQTVTTSARTQGALVLSGAAYDLSATPPYGPWLELIREYPRQEELPEFITSREAIARLGSQEELHAAVFEFFLKVAGQTPLVLILEDLHWSDQVSLDLLRYMARQVSDARILIVGTYRDDEITWDHHLSQILPALVRESSPERIDLRSLDQTAIGEFVDHHLGIGEPDRERLIRYLLARTEGNPLFIEELVRDLERDNVLRRSSDGWSLGSLVSTTVPLLIRQMVERRMSDLSASTTSGLQIAAVIGQTVSLDRWEQVTEFPVARAVEEALDSYLVIESRNSEGVEFRHALVREAVRATISLPQRREVHRLIAESYLGDPNPEPSTVAWHLKQAGDSRSGEWLIRAAEQAEQRFAWKIAVERYEEAVNILRERGDQDHLLARVLLRMGRLFRFSDQKRTVEYLEQSRRLALQVGDEVTAAFALFNIGAYERVPGPKQPRIDKMLGAIETLENTQQDVTAIGKWAVTRVSAELDSLTTIRGTCALQLAWSGNPRDAIALATKYLPEDWDAEPVRMLEFSDQYPNSSYVDAYAGLAIAFSHMGLPHKSELASRLQLNLARQLNFRPGLALQTNCILLLEHFPYRTSNLNERADMRAFIEDGSSEARESLSRANETFGLDYCYLIDGRWDQLRSRTQAGINPSISVLWHMTMFAHTRFAIYEGNPEQAGMFLYQLLPNGLDEKPGDHIHPVPGETQRLGALLALQKADLEHARAWLIAHDAWMEWTGAVLGRADGLLLWAMVHLAEGDTEDARARAYEALSQAKSPEQPMALIAVHRFLGELATQMGETHDAKSHLEESLELAEACAVPFERALTMLAQAELELFRDNHSIARELLTKVREICADLGARPTLERAEKLLARLEPRRVENPSGLTGRELEVLHLLVQGKADREIADELFISYRTVTNHVASILRKLDVDSRTAAATQAVRRGLA